MRYEQFQLAAARQWREIPPEFKAGVEGVEVERRALAHPKLRDIYTLGECLTESWPSSYDGPETLRSRVVLYYGSFLRLSRLEADFDWEGEIWETLTHELRHHLESLASEDALEDVDYAADENFKRLEGEPYDPYFFRAGEVLAPGVYAVEDDVFIEVEHAGGRLAAQVEFELGRTRYRVRAPRGEADVWLIRLTAGVAARGEAYLVLTRRAGLVEKVRSVFRHTAARVREEEAAAERVSGAEPEGDAD
ncbi:MAG TPA: metallopeptidase family protein [Longimicrobiales bacterium]